MGTAFLATHEAFDDFKELGLTNQAMIDAYKRKLIEGIDEDEQITRMYSGKTTRVIKNKLVELWDKSELKTLRMPYQGLLIGDLHQGLVEKGETDYLAMFAGQITGMIKEIRSAKEVVDEVVNQAVMILTKTLPGPNKK
jgi:NAD(P)H-dependent flavin oxidoreductase YrpB (nitropropane dioxygenase family)